MLQPLWERVSFLKKRKTGIHHTTQSPSTLSQKMKPNVCGKAGVQPTVLPSGTAQVCPPPRGVTTGSTIRKDSSQHHDNRSPPGPAWGREAGFERSRVEWLHACDILRMTRAQMWRANSRLEARGESGGVTVNGPGDRPRPRLPVTRWPRFPVSV